MRVLRKVIGMGIHFEYFRHPTAVMRRITKREEIMSNETSSSEDEFERIKEAVDFNFLTDELYCTEKLEPKSEAAPKLALSLRNANHHDISTNPFSIKVTPEYQKHVAKHLSKLLDKLIDDSKVIHKRKAFREKRKVNCGVKLLSSSEEYLSASISHKSIKQFKRKPRKRVLTNKDYEKNAKEVAVSSEWVLSQEGTKYWAPSTKGEIEVVKLK